jgi:hypothetical protein
MKISRQDAVAELWRRGICSYKLSHNQQVALQEMRNSAEIKFVINATRRFGKDAICITDAIEWGLKTKDGVAGYIAPTQKMLKRIVRPIWTRITKDCPTELMPQWLQSDGCYVFPSTGARVYLSGTDNQHYESLRGQTLHVTWISEAGFCDDLEYIISDILTPQLLTTNGKLRAISTPPVTTGHHFYDMAMMAKSKGAYLERTIDDIDYIDEEIKAKFIEEAGGKDSITARREYYVEFLTDVARAVIPEFTKDVEKLIVQDPARPEAFKLVAALDPGVRDNTGYLIGYYDFKAAKIVIDNELFLGSSTTTEIYTNIINVEKEYEGKDVRRYSDTALQLILDLNRLHGLNIIPTEKKDKDAQINILRVGIQNGTIIIRPRCTNLIRQLGTCVWNNARTGWDRNKIDGHFDLIDAAIYLIRNIDKSNPYPTIMDSFNKYEMQQSASFVDPKTDLRKAIIGR